jgi:hypothetical protein
VSIHESTELGSFLHNLDDIQLMRLDIAVQKALVSGDLIPDELTDALGVEILSRSHEATLEKNSKKEPALAILWYLHSIERNHREAAEYGQDIEETPA